MGWLCTTAAARTMEVIAAACAASRKQHGEQQTSNVFFANRQRYFYEISRRDQSDGGIAGTIYLCLGEDHCRKVSTFRIDGAGRVVRGPALFKRGEVG
jgi:hypothetical protein